MASGLLVRRKATSPVAILITVMLNTEVTISLESLSSLILTLKVWEARKSPTNRKRDL